MDKQLLPRPARAVKPGTNFPLVRPFHWPDIEAGQWLIMRLHCSQVLYVVCVVDNQLGTDAEPALTVRFGQPANPVTIRRQDIRTLKRCSGPLRARRGY